MILPSASVFASGILDLWLDLQLRWHARCSVEHKTGLHTVRTSVSGLGFALGQSYFA